MVEASISELENEFKDSHKPSYPLQFPISYLIQKHLTRVTSSSPLKWEVNHKYGVSCKEIEGKPWKRLKHWRKGRQLEEAIEEAFVEKLGFILKESPEALGIGQLFRNCCYENNGYGADFIVKLPNDSMALIEAKVRRKYLEPSDIIKSALPRFYDLDPHHKYVWLLPYWGKISDEAKDLLWKHDIILITIPFSPSLQTKLTPEMKGQLSSYIAARIQDLMAMFTSVKKCRVKGDTEVVEELDYRVNRVDHGVFNSYYDYLGTKKEYVYEYYFDKKPPSSPNFDHNVRRQYRRLKNQMHIYRILTGDVESTRWKNIWNVYQQKKNYEWLRP